MGYRNMMAVMDAIVGSKKGSDKNASVKGPNVHVPWKDGDNRKKGAPDWQMGPYEFSMLLTIAYRQHDEDETHPDADCICWGGESVFVDLIGMGQTKYYECAEFLKRSELVTYKKKGRYPDPRHESGENTPPKMTTFTNVWHLNKPKLALMKSCGGSVAVRDADKSVHDADDSVRDADVSVRHADVSVRHANTKITKETTKENTTTTKEKGGNSSSSVEDVDNSVANRNTDYYIDLICKLGNLTPDEQKQILKHFIHGATQNKDPQKVVEVIKSAIKDEGIAAKRDSFGEWIKLIVSRLRKTVPPLSDGKKCPLAQEVVGDISANFKRESKEVVYTEADWAWCKANCHHLLVGDKCPFPNRPWSLSPDFGKEGARCINYCVPLTSPEGRVS